LLAPKGAPHNIVTRLNAVVQRALAMKDIQDTLANQGFEPSGCSPEEFSSLIASDGAKWARAVKASGAKLD
jgi:tripartite-type tricarboxylate transporter receptor subunit TctC